ncbi:MAG: glycoside hydrolase/phage tail family protein, partial [Deltaproteobacteria bacterium]
MATIVLGAIGAAAGASIGGGVLGLSSVVIGRAIGSTLGRIIDQRLLGAGSAAVETGRVDRFRVTGASEGAAVADVYGRVRIGGQVIWAGPFIEHVKKSGGGKGAPPKPKTKTYSYTVSLAIALCEGEISHVGRIWADGEEVAASDLGMRIYKGDFAQLPDVAIEAELGAGETPAFRGTAYVVFEDLDLGDFGNRVPQFSFEVFRPAPLIDGLVPDPSWGTQGVAMIPGTGEYALATTAVHYKKGAGVVDPANVHTPLGKTDFTASLEALTGEMPNVGSVSLVVAWFGDDLRCGNCTITPRVEQKTVEGDHMAWRVSGVTRAAAQLVPVEAGKALYGATPADQSVVEAIQALKAAGLSPVFNPFVLMAQLTGNALPDPWMGTAGQPALPWRGRITTSLAPGMLGSPDGSAAADDEVAAFFGTATPGEFTVSGTTVNYTSAGQGYRRFILHYAHLCKAAGGVDAFLLGSELRGLTRIRGASGFPAVQALKALAADVRAIMGPSVKISYGADWSEYAGYSPNGTNDLHFPLDALWADANVDFVGIDNYLPLADWRDGRDHADADAGSIHNMAYLQSNIEGGEGYDWYYDGDAGSAVQDRLPITDGAYDEPWVWRAKDIRSWWNNEHFERLSGIRQVSPTAWQPGLKPIWFTEYGCAAVDKGANEPNRFLDVKSSESGLPRASNGRRDDFMQMQVLRAVQSYWADPSRNPTSLLYGGTMIDMSRAHVWAWDARPFPWFPNADDIWSDGGNYARGHWLNGRGSGRSLALVVAEICVDAGLTEIDVSELYGIVRGFVAEGTATPRSVLQTLMVAYGFDALERDGVLVFRTRGLRDAVPIDPQFLAIDGEAEGDHQLIRAPDVEIAGRVRVNFTEANGSYETRTSEAVFADDDEPSLSVNDIPLVLTASEGRSMAERWLAEARVARDTLALALPPSSVSLGAGDV